MAEETAPATWRPMVGQSCTVPDRKVHAWGYVLEVDGNWVRVRLHNSELVPRRGTVIRWYLLEQLEPLNRSGSR